MIPWQWAWLNLTLVVCTILLDLVVENLFGALSLGILFALNLAAFVVDVVLVDYYDAL